MEVKVFLVCACRLTVIFAAATMVSACFTPISLEEQIPDLAHIPTSNILLSVIDQRRRVIDGGKPPIFIGRTHGAFGIPTSWHGKHVLNTEEGDQAKFLAECIQHRLEAGMVESGWQAREVLLKTV